MSKLRNVADLISNQLLPRVRAPGQYIGLETNARRKDVQSAEVTVALAFPDAYSLGISHLGSQVLYHMLNDIPWVAADRAYCPFPDAESVCRQIKLPLFGWESRCALADFDIVGFSLSYEMCATNVLTMLDLAGIPLHSADRRDGQPIVVAGDCLADAPEPMADFIDVFIAGDGEEPTKALVEVVRAAKAGSAGPALSREETLLRIAQTVPAAYVPRFYQPRYDSSGCFAGLERTRDDVPERIERAHIARLSDSPAITAPLAPLSEAVYQRVTIEIARGCPNACRFCQAGAVRLPVRIRSIDEIISIAEKALEATGYREVSLLSLSASDYPRLEELIDRLNAAFADRYVSVSLPSLRVSKLLANLPRLTSVVRKGGLTIAAEAATPRLRSAIGKEITDEDMIAGVRAAYAAGWRSVKVYFMAGLPGESEDDIDAIFDLCRALSDARREVDGQRGAISTSVSWFVPKPHTPMQWCAMHQPEYFFAVRRRLRELSRRTPISFKFHRIERSVLEAVICRGDRRMGAAIEAAWRAGARMDGWDEHFDYEKWTATFAAAGIDPAAIAHQPFQLGQVLPWSHIICRRSEKFLIEEYRRMMMVLEEPQK